MARYTADEMREAANAVDEVSINDNCEFFYEKHEKFNPFLVRDMLRHAADILDGVLNEITVIEKMPTADLDGAFEHQKVNGERLMAKISFYDKVKEIVGGHNV